MLYLIVDKWWKLFTKKNKFVNFKQIVEQLVGLPIFLCWVHCITIVSLCFQTCKCVYYLKVNFCTIKTPIDVTDVMEAYLLL